MNIKVDRADLLLAPKETLPLEQALGAKVRCLRGSVWVTQDGDYRDYYLYAGDTVHLDRPGLALVYALEPAEVLVSARAEAASWAGRVSALLGRAARAASRWIEQSYGPDAIQSARMRDWHGV